MSDEVAYFRGEGGGIWKMDLPLPEQMAAQLTKGHLTRVNPDGSPYTPPASGGERPSVDPPSPSALKAEWVGYAVRVHGLAPDDAEAMTKADLIERYGPRPE